MRFLLSICFFISCSKKCLFGKKIKKNCKYVKPNEISHRLISRTAEKEEDSEMEIVRIYMTIKTKSRYLLNRRKNYGGGAKREKLYIKEAK